MVFPFADAVSVPVASMGPIIFKVPVVPWVQLDPATEPVMPVAALVVTVPLFVTVMAPLIAILPANERFAVERIVCAALMVSIPVFVIDPVPSIVVAAPLSVGAPVPLIVPFTIRFPETPSVFAPVARIPVALTVRPVIVVAPTKVTVCPALMTALSPAAGIPAPPHVPERFQFPDPDEVKVAALALLETTKRTASAADANRTERNVLDSSFTLSYQLFLLARFFFESLEGFATYTSILPGCLFRGFSLFVLILIV